MADEYNYDPGLGALPSRNIEDQANSLFDEAVSELSGTAWTGAERRKKKEVKRQMSHPR